MSYDNLSRSHQELLRWMVFNAEGDRALKNFKGKKYDTYSSPREFSLISPDCDERNVELETLEALEEARLINLWINPNKEDINALTCSLRELAFEAVKNDFKKPKKPFKTVKKMEADVIITGNVNTDGGNFTGHDTNVKASNGSIASGNQVSKSTISNIQSVDDQIEELTEKIRNEIIKELTNPQERSEYESKLFSLKKELFSEKPDASNFKKLFNTLGFFGDIEGSISLMARVWPFLYPLLQIAIDRAMI